MIFLAAFVLLGGWIPVVEAFADSFAHVGPAAFVARDAWLRFALALPSTILHAAFLVAAPAIAVACASQLALAAVARVVPRFASFTLAFPIVLTGALLVTLAAVPLLAPLGARPVLVVPWSAAR
jgi:flagellar biosynthesis protein FliR